MEALLILFLAVGLIAVFESSAISFGVDSREHRLDDYRRSVDPGGPNVLA